MKKILALVLALVMVVALGVGLVACNPTEAEDTTIYVGNTAGTTGYLASIGVPFNLGIEAALAAYNAEGGFNGRNVALKHYDDGGNPTQSLSLMEKLIYEDEVFAIVGNYGGYAVNVNLDTIKAEKVPMVYAAAGIDALYNANADTAEEKVVFPVQPLNITEGRVLLARALAAAFVPDANAETGFALTGGLGATKVGVLACADEASQGMLNGIKMEKETLSAARQAAVFIQDLAGTAPDFAAAAQALVAEGCDTVIVTVTGTNFVAALTALANANYTGNVLTSYNNASADVLNDSKTKLMTETGLDIMSKMTIYSQGWLDISSLTYVYNEDTALVAAYKKLGDLYANGVTGFNEEYWGVAENIYNYAIAAGNNETTAFAMSYNSFALAGYIAGDLFCQGLKELQAQGKELTRENYVAIMESKEFKVAMGGMISYADGLRAGVDMFSVSVFYDTFDYGLEYHSAGSIAYSGLTGIDYFRGLIVG